MAEEARRGTDIGREKEGKGKERRRRKRDTGFTDRQRLAAGRTGSRPASQASRSERPSWVSAPTDVCIVVYASTCTRVGACVWSAAAAAAAAAGKNA